MRAHGLGIGILRKNFAVRTLAKQCNREINDHPLAASTVSRTRRSFGSGGAFAKVQCCHTHYSAAFRLKRLRRDVPGTLLSAFRDLPRLHENAHSGVPAARALYLAATAA